MAAILTRFVRSQLLTSVRTGNGSGRTSIGARRGRKAELSTRKRKVDGNLRVYRHGLAVPHIRLVAPVLDGVDSRGNQERVTSHQFQFLDCTVFRDVGIENYRALHMSLPRQRWIVGHDFLYEKTSCIVWRQANPLERLCWAFICRRR